MTDSGTVSGSHLTRVPLDITITVINQGSETNTTFTIP